MMKLPMPIQHAGRDQRLLGERDVPDAGVEIRRHELDDQEHHDRQRRQDQRGGAAFRRQRADLAPHLEALADHAGQIFQNLAEIAAGRALDRDRGDEQRQIVLADPDIEIAQRRFEIGAVGDLVHDDAELAADRILHLARDHGQRDRRRVAGAQAAHDHVERIGELRAERLLAARAQEAHAPGTAAQCRRTARSARRRSDCRGRPCRARSWRWWRRRRSAGAC